MPWADFLKVSTPLALASLARHNRLMEHSDIVTASEIADFVFCPEAWRLAQFGHESANQSERDAGTAHHARKATAERIAGGAIAFGLGLITLALVALALIWFLSR
jgi:hypothetical protein